MQYFLRVLWTGKLCSIFVEAFCGLKDYVQNLAAAANLCT